MRSGADIQLLSLNFEKLYGFNPMRAEQGSEAWHKSRLGVITASNAHKVVAKKDSATRHTYMCELVAEVATGVYEEINSKYLDWGKLQESSARETYQYVTESTVQEAGFIFKDETYREGVSVDGLVDNSVDSFPLELKCPYNSVHYIKFIAEDAIKSEYLWQCQFGMRVTDSSMYHVAQYDPRVLSRMLHYVPVERDEKMQATLSDAVPQFIKDMDDLLKRLGLEYGQQWKS